MNRSITAIATTLLLVVVAACSSGSSPSGDTSSEEPTATVNPSTEASEDGTLPSFAPGAGDLDDLLPDEVGGIPIGYKFDEGQGVLGGEGVTPEVQDFLDRVGASMDDVTTAFGRGLDTASGGFVAIFAVRVAGADEGVLRDEFRQVLEEDSDNVFTEATLGGKEILAFGTAGAAADGYLYVHDDVVFTVGASTPELSEEALSLLP